MSPSSTSEKVLGERPAVVNWNACGPFGAATFITVSLAGKMTASADSCMSLFPP